VVRFSLFAGVVLVDFRSVTPVWRKISGDLPVVESTGSVPIAVPFGRFSVEDEGFPEGVDQRWAFPVL
jgi:hypothetical protein